LVVPENDSKPHYIDVLVSGTGQFKVEANIVDLIIDDQGKSLTKAGTTPYSLESQLNLAVDKPLFKLNNSQRLVRIQVSFRGIKLSKVKYGGVQISVGPAFSSSGASKLAAVTTVAIVPQGKDFDLELAKVKPVSTSNLALVQLKRQSPADWLIPDIPGILNSGPAVLNVTARNENELPLYVAEKVEWHFGNSQRKVATNAGSLLIGGQERKLSYSSQQQMVGSDLKLNFLPEQGAVTAKIEINSYLGNTVFKPLTLKASAIIFPWKEWVLNLTLFGLLLWFLLRKRANKDSKTKEPSLAKLFVIFVIKETRKKLKTKSKF
jgi:hypothetical protein